jgi:hypothetical protein
VVSGSNGTCSPTVLCRAGAGWDGPTGLGTPNGTATFNGSGGTTPPPFALSGVAGSTVTLSFSGTADTSLQTSFVVDDAVLTVS